MRVRGSGRAGDGWGGWGVWGTGRVFRGVQAVRPLSSARRGVWIAPLLLLLLPRGMGAGDESGGEFGTWSTDGTRFAWTLDEAAPQAVWESSESGFPLYVNRTDHFAVSGNNRVRGGGAGWWEGGG
jgi:hypothetical protein